MRCGRNYDIAAPPEFLNAVSSKDLAGDALVMFVAEELGWPIKVVKRNGVTPALYSVCPDCVEKDFQEYIRNR
jgi:hypothetical protein